MPSLSPDGQFVGVEGMEEATGEDVWIHGVARSTKTRLTLDPAKDSRAIWSPDGKEIAFWSNRGEAYGMFTISADGQTKPIVIDGKPMNGWPATWSPDGKYLVYDFFCNLCWLERKPDSSGWANSTCWQNSSWRLRRVSRRMAASWLTARENPALRRCTSGRFRRRQEGAHLHEQRRTAPLATRRKGALLGGRRHADCSECFHYTDILDGCDPPTFLGCRTWIGVGCFLPMTCRQTASGSF